MSTFSFVSYLHFLDNVIFHSLSGKKRVSQFIFTKLGVKMFFGNIVYSLRIPFLSEETVKISIFINMKYVWRMHDFYAKRVLERTCLSVLSHYLIIKRNILSMEFSFHWLFVAKRLYNTLMGKGNIMQKENWKVFCLYAVNQEIEFST